MESINTFKSLENLVGNQALGLRSQAHVIIIGVGGIGSWCAEYLVRSAIGKITLIDLDDICISNTNRQLHTQRSTLGRSKVQTLKSRMEDINPNAKVIGIEDFLTADNIAQYIKTDAYILDAIDSLSVKCELINYCLDQKIKLVTTGGAGGKTDPTKIIVADLSVTYNDPLLLRIRKRLRRCHDFPKKKKINLGIPTVFSPEEMKVNSAATICENLPIIPNCNNSLGTCVTVISSFAIYATKEVLNLIDHSANKTHE